MSSRTYNFHSNKIVPQAQVSVIRVLISGTCVLSLRTRVPELRTYVLTKRTCVPTKRTRVPGLRTCVPELGTRVPEIRTCVPKLRTRPLNHLITFKTI